jgi:hypothetical protein
MNKLNLSLKEHFIYVFAFFVTASTFAFDLMLCFHQIPNENKSIVDFIAGVLNTSCLVTVIGFFYSSTASSREKNKMLLEAEKKKENE